MPDAPTTPDTNLPEVRRKSIKGGTITAASQIAGILIQLASTVFLARILSPEDYGIMAMVTAMTAFAGLFRDLGLSSASVQKAELTEAQAGNLFWLNTAMGAALSALMACCAPLIAWYYSNPDLIPLTLLLSLTFLIGGLGTQSGALLVRHLQFGRQAAATLTGSLTSLGVSIALACYGLHYWSLAWGTVIGGITTTIGLILLSPLKIRLWHKGAGLRSLLKFGAHVTAFDVINYFQRNLDNLLIGRFWGAEHLGVYSRAYSLLMMPISSIRGPINAVAFPALSRLSHDPASFRTYYLKTTAIIATLSMPMAAFFFVSSAPLIELLLGPKWSNVTSIFSYLAIAALIQPAAGFSGSMLLSLGKSRLYVKCGIFNALIISIAFLIGIPWGEHGVAIAYAVANYVVLFPWLYWAHRNGPVTMTAFIQSFSLPFVAALAAILPAWIAFQYTPSLAPITRLPLMAIAYFPSYIAILGLTPHGRSLLETITRLVTSVFTRSTHR